MDAIIHFAVYRSSFVSVMSKLLIPGPWKNRRRTFPETPTSGGEPSQAEGTPVSGYQVGSSRRRAD